MSGLIVKDLELIRVNIKIYLAVFAIGVVYLIAKKDSAAFFTSYMIVMSVGLSAGTVSYDSYEKGMNFLMTLPVTRKQYVYEKYLLSMLITLITGAVSFLAGIMKVQLSGNGMVEDILVGTAAALFVAGLLLALVIPLRIKYEAEKSRIIMLGFIAASFLVGIAGKKIIEMSHGTIYNIEEILDSLSAGNIILSGVVIFAVVVLISVGCSCRIINNKEF